MLTFFFNKLTGETTHEYNFEDTVRWIPNEMFEKPKKIILPVNLGNLHWALAVIFIKDQIIIYYDFMWYDGSHVLHALLKFVEDVWKRHNN